MRMMPMFTKQFEISKEAISVFGFASSETILLYEGCCRVFSILISFMVNEKNAISEPEKRNDKTKSTSKTKTRMVVSADVIARIVSN
jgi:hypothetical protein